MSNQTERMEKLGKALQGIGLQYKSIKFSDFSEEGEDPKVLVVEITALAVPRTITTVGYGWEHKDAK